VLLQWRFCFVYGFTVLETRVLRGAWKVEEFQDEQRQKGEYDTKLAMDLIFDIFDLYTRLG